MTRSQSGGRQASFATPAWLHLIWLVLLAGVMGLGGGAARAAERWEKVPGVDWGKVKLADFKDEELDLVFILAHFAEVANAVVENGETRGFINIAVWRKTEENKPYNARVMENYLAFAFFYCADRPWNIYRGMPAVRTRLEAVLEYWLKLQSEDGQFPQYGVGKNDLAATAFATKFMGESVRLMNFKGGPPLDQGLLERVRLADRKAIMATLKLAELWKTGKKYTNQYLNVVGGALAYLALWPDEEMAEALAGRMKEIVREFQSPAGYYYEKESSDFGYSLDTYASDVWMAWHYARGTEIGRMLEASDAKWNEWLGWNLLREPDGSLFVINRGIESRQHHAAWIRQENPLAEKVESARAFTASREEKAAQWKERREELGKNWGKPTPLKMGVMHTFRPYDFLARSQYKWWPSEAQRNEAVGKLPFLAREVFNHQSVDNSRVPIIGTYIRRPTYYAAFNMGLKRNVQQRFGLGLLWNKETGTFLQTQSGSSDFAWGTQRTAGGLVVEAENFIAEMEVGGKPVKPAPGTADLAAGDVVLRYKLVKNGAKTVTFSDQGLTVEVKCPGEFTEILPLLTHQGEKVVVEKGRAVLVRGRRRVVIEGDGTFEVRKTEKSEVREMGLTAVRMRARDALKYSVHVE